MYLERLKAAIQQDRDALIDHPLYEQVNTVKQLQIFVQYHVFAVWDFMSLLKGLQQNLTCISIPWYPVGSANTRYLINEIVLGEESDVDEDGIRISHFELYLKAMTQMGATVEVINDFIDSSKNSKSIQEAISTSQLPEFIKSFLSFTFEVIEQQPDYVQAAVFTFGREDLIPAMFIGMVKDLAIEEHNNLSTYKYYLERHIEVDGDHHSHLALQMVAELCGDDPKKWAAATAFSIKALQQRKALWDGTLLAIQNTLLQQVA